MIATSRDNPQGIDVGDTVFHHPSQETWIVAYVRGRHLSWCGWPEGEAQIADCELKEQATVADRQKLLERLAGVETTLAGSLVSDGGSTRQRHARSALAAAAPADASPPPSLGSTSDSWRDPYSGELRCLITPGDRGRLAIVRPLATKAGIIWELVPGEYLARHAELADMVRELEELRPMADFIRVATSRGLSDARCGQGVEMVGERGELRATGVIVGHNDSANFDVLFSDGPYAGQVLNVHPHYVRLLGEERR